MRSRFLLSLAGLALLAACTESAPDRVPTAGIAPGLSQSSGANACPPVDAVRVQIDALFPTSPPLRQEATARFNAILRSVRAGDLTTAQALMFRLVDYTLKRYYQGLLIGARTPAAQVAMSNIVDALYCTVGLPQPNFPPSSFGDAGAVGVVQPTSPRTQIVTPTQFAGVDVPAAAAPTTTTIAVIRLPDVPAPLNTPLDQYPSFFEFMASPPVTFNQDVLVGACQVANFSVPDYGRLKLGHNLGTTGFELLPRATPPFLDCTNINPNGIDSSDPTINGGCCLGGTTKNFSPFGAVDTLTILDAASVPKFPGVPNGAVPLNQLPAIQVRTPLGNPVPGLVVTFTIPAGSEGSISGAAQVTDSDGYARLGGWTLGAGLLPNTVIATVTPFIGSGVDRNGLVFTAELP